MFVFRYSFSILKDFAYWIKFFSRQRVYFDCYSIQIGYKFTHFYYRVIREYFLLLHIMAKYGMTYFGLLGFRIIILSFLIFFDLLFQTPLISYTFSRLRSTWIHTIYVSTFCLCHMLSLFLKIYLFWFIERIFSLSTADYN